MRYRIGEVAELFGMTKEGVRFLERQGIIRSQRDESNGYRYFDRPEITRLKMIKSYQSLGFSLEEADEIVCRTKRGELLGRIDEKLRDLEEKEEQLRRMKAMLKAQRHAAQSVLDGESRFELAMRPELIVFPVVRDEASGATHAEKEDIATARQAEKVWIQAMPPVMLGAIHFDEHGRETTQKFGCAALASTVKELGLPVLPSMIHLPACLCACGTLEAPPMQRADIRPMIEWADTQGYRVCGSVYATMVQAFCDEDGNARRIHSFYVPVCEKK